MFGTPLTLWHTTYYPKTSLIFFVSSTTKKYIANYLRGRKKLCRAPQCEAGSATRNCLSPMLFNIHLRKIPTPLRGIYLTSYADDCIPYTLLETLSSRWAATWINIWGTTWLVPSPTTSTVTEQIAHDIIYFLEQRSLICTIIPFSCLESNLPDVHLQPAR